MRYLNFVLFSAERKLFSGLQNNFLVPSIAFGHSAKSVRKKDVRSIPALFKASIKKWCKLLDEEIRNDNEILKQLCAEDSGMQMLEKRGLGVTRLNVVGLNHDPMDGMTLLLSRQSPFWSPQKWLRPGSPAVLNIVNGSSLNEVVDCVIRKATSAQIELMTLVLAPSQTKGALHSLQNFLESKEVYTGAGSRLIDYAFRGAHMPSFHERRLSNLDTDFNESQVRAISASMNSKRPFLCIQGPPGTGKTKVISKITQMLIEKGKKVLLCAPSNVATDNVYDSTLSLISKGSPKRISEIFNVANQREAVCEDPEFGTLQELSNQLKSASSKEKKPN
ncbi:unnamed protein product [Caenorhabditis auriculariae]|uniref:DNA2/NAM7 helicase helicase domain-containing protein n=1 Tax=Caenorhabditis auriculariae TaxID=2777116 RepID=A0A8S1GMG9_9PELO|nr:unnamed protein product [Caenorhabditis auriculariae]